ncbi:MAG: YciI family protein [Verrucomicrobiota bacterium]|jgi:uncharacterized protein YciI
MKYYIFKLLPPRPDFAATMTPAELALMQTHSAYLKGFMDKGQILVFGPVLDPVGAYGLAVVRLPDDIAPDTIWSNDPVIKAQAGFSYHIAPMLNAVFPQQ